MCDVHMFSWYVMFAFSHIALGPVQYEYLLRAKHAFDEDDSFTTPSPESHLLARIGAADRQTS